MKKHQTGGCFKRTFCNWLWRCSIDSDSTTVWAKQGPANRWCRSTAAAESCVGEPNTRLLHRSQRQSILCQSLVQGNIRKPYNSEMKNQGTPNHVHGWFFKDRPYWESDWWFYSHFYFSIFVNNLLKETWQHYFSTGKWHHQAVIDFFLFEPCSYHTWINGSLKVALMASRRGTWSTRLQAVGRMGRVLGPEFQSWSSKVGDLRSKVGSSRVELFSLQLHELHSGYFGHKQLTLRTPKSDISPGWKPMRSKGAKCRRNPSDVVFGMWVGSWNWEVPQKVFLGPQKLTRAAVSTWSFWNPIIWWFIFIHVEPESTEALHAPVYRRSKTINQS